MTTPITSEQALSSEEIDNLIVEHQGWAESIARSVARAWSMDWKADGLDGAAMEALIFCARRFDPARGVPFKGYARRRIHEASTEEARRSRSWKTGINQNATDQRAREVSAQLFDVFPELRDGSLPFFDEGSGEDDFRAAVRGLLVGASIIASRLSGPESGPEEMLDFKRMIELMAALEPVHQIIIWKTYWEGGSLRSVADEWETDELNVMREHKALIDYLHRSMTKHKRPERPKIRPGLRPIALKLKRKQGAEPEGPFQQMMNQFKVR